MKNSYVMGLLNFKEGFMWKFFRKYHIIPRACETKSLTFWPFSRLSNGQNAVKTPKATLLSQLGSQQLTRQLLPTTAANSPIKHLAERFYSFLSPRISLQAQFPNQQWLFCVPSILQRGQRRSHAAMMYKLMGWESEASGYVSEQLVDLIMRSPEMSSALAPRHN